MLESMESSRCCRLASAVSIWPFCPSIWSRMASSWDLAASHLLHDRVELLRAVGQVVDEVLVLVGQGGEQAHAVDQVGQAVGFEQHREEAIVATRLVEGDDAVLELLHAVVVLFLGVAELVAEVQQLGVEVGELELQHVEGLGVALELVVERVDLGLHGFGLGCEVAHLGLHVAG